MNERFTYDEHSSLLISADGRPLKRVQCPRARHWNQLLVDAPGERQHGCRACRSRVIDLDQVDPGEVTVQLAQRWDHTCVQASARAGRVSFLADPSAPPELADAQPGDTPWPIRTVHGTADINRAVGMGYWPDVRGLAVGEDGLRPAIAVWQHSGSGRVEDGGDFRADMLREGRATLDWSARGQVMGKWQERVRVRWYDAADTQGEPLAAYLIPPGIANGTEVQVLDLIAEVPSGAGQETQPRRAADCVARVHDRRVVWVTAGSAQG